MDYEIYAVTRIHASVDGNVMIKSFVRSGAARARITATTAPTFHCAANSAACPNMPSATVRVPGISARRYFASLVDEQHAPWRDDLRYITAEVLCTSRDLPLMLQQEMGKFVLPDSLPVKKSASAQRANAAASGAGGRVQYLATGEPATDELPEPD